MITMKNDTLAAFMNRWLQDNDRSYRWLARRAGVSHTIVTDMTKGHVPKIDYLIAIEKAMGVGPGELICLAAKIEERGGAGRRVISALTRGWKSFPPDLQRDFDEFFETATAAEAIELFKDAIRTWLLKRDLSDGDETLLDKELPSPERGLR